MKNKNLFRLFLWKMTLLILFMSGCSESSDDAYFTIDQPSGTIASGALRSYVKDGIGRTRILEAYDDFLNPRIQFPEDTSKYSVYRDNRDRYIVTRDVVVSFQDSVGESKQEQMRVHLYTDGRCVLSEKTGISEDKQQFSRETPRKSTSKPTSTSENPPAEKKKSPEGLSVQSTGM